MRSTGREHVVLDVREAKELDICELDGALHIPMANVPAHRQPSDESTIGRHLPSWRSQSEGRRLFDG
jgi:rhodanese-related sulfurtransferase